MASSLWSSACMASTSRLLYSRASASLRFSANVSSVLRSAACRRSYAREAVRPASVDAGQKIDVPFSTLEGKVTKETLDAVTVKPFKLETMSPVQAEVLPMLPTLAEPYTPDSTHVRDLLVRAKTGTGKTIAFLIPAIEARLKSIQEYLSGNTDIGDLETAKRRFARRTVGTLVISPTRELATQIANEALRLTMHHRDFEVRLFTGGSSKRMQMRDWMKGRKDIVVSTPGRLRDLLESEPDVRSAIGETSILILDEADTLLDMGFREDIEEIKTFIPPTPQRQTLLFSATVSKQIQQVARSTLAKNHRYINCVSEETSPVHAHVEQYHTILPSPSAQLPHILRLIAHDQFTNPGKSKVIIFLPTTKMTQLFSTLVSSLAFNALPAGKNTRVYEIHSKRTQEQRTKVSDAFRHSRSGATVLITTDVSARGVDYPGVTRVIQVGIPGGREEYIHRVGRTGRANSAGRGDLVLLPWEIGFVTWQLTDVPLKPLTVNELTEDVNQMSAKFDEDPADFFVKAKAPVRESLFLTPVSPVMKGLDGNVGNILGRLDEDAIRETMLSLLGYYLSKTPELRVQRDIVVQGCQDWTTGACGLATPPYVAKEFLRKLGYSDGRTKHWGKEAQSMPRYGRAREQPWQGRGSQTSRDIKRRPNWDGSGMDEGDQDDGDASEYKTSRYMDSGNGYPGKPGDGRGQSAEFRGGFGGRKPMGSFGTGVGYQGGPMGVDRSRGPRDDNGSEGYRGGDRQRNGGYRSGGYGSGGHGGGGYGSGGYGAGRDGGRGGGRGGYNGRRDGGSSRGGRDRSQSYDS
ncbi:DEAD-domain-containing protein [Favolaschia claudopus]|uniref:ATP-dependent RNA helicase n=1 Tax=Favolaschia claudopus TaxID=2862362 RepID=A0AAW0E761_9AGAR